MYIAVTHAGLVAVGQILIGSCFKQSAGVLVRKKGILLYKIFSAVLRPDGDGAGFAAGKYKKNFFRSGFLFQNAGVYILKMNFMPILN